MAKHKKKTSKPTPEPEDSKKEPIEDIPDEIPETESPNLTDSPPTEPTTNLVENSEKDRKLNKLFWLRVGLAVIAGTIATFIFEGIEGIEMLNSNLIESYFPINFRRNKFAEPYHNRWTPDNPTNDYPAFVNPLSQGRKTVNSKTVQDASYIKLKNIKLAYNIPEEIKWLPSGQIFFSFK
ncbi:MAG: hypothetical protein P8X83_06535 [Nitrosopumilaceae archaeon]